MADTALEAGADQYLRTISLVVFGTDLNGLDLSQLRIKFVVKRSDYNTPNTADIRVYNLEAKTAIRIQNEFKRVILQAGYAGNYGVIFQGNIKQVIIGRESATDTFIDITAGDGDRAYNFAVVNQTIAAGATAADQLVAVNNSMSPKGVGIGYSSNLPTTSLPRGKVMYGNARKYVDSVAGLSDSRWSIQDEKLTFVPRKGYLPNQAVVLTSKTGMVNTPQQTNEGINVQCLLNPLIKVGGRIKIDNSSVEKYKINYSVPGSPSNTPAALNADGFYYVFCAEHKGDTRGRDWYTSLICLNLDISANPINSVQTNYGG